MLFPGKRAPREAPHPNAGFWDWWSDTGRTVDPSGADTELIDELTRRVRAVHPRLAWAFSPGSSARHRLTLSAGGDPEVRADAERWVQGAAIHTDEHWEFRASREAEPAILEQRLEISGAELDLSQTTFRVDPADEDLRIAVGVFHPSFPSLTPGAPDRVAVLILEWLLGEDEVERWVGRIDALRSASDEHTTAKELSATVSRIAASRDPETWAFLEWQDAEGFPGMGAFHRHLRWIDHAALDAHHQVHIRYRARKDGFPARDRDLERFLALEQEIEAVLDGSGIIVGHGTSRGIRTVHVYLDSNDRRAASELRRFARRRRLRVESSHDPSWRDLRPFMS